LYKAKVFRIILKTVLTFCIIPNILIADLKLISNQAIKNLAFENSHFQKRHKNSTQLLYRVFEILQGFSEEKGGFFKYFFEREVKA